MIKGRDRRNRPRQRCAHRKDLAIPALSTDIARKDFAIVLDRQLAREGIDIACTPDLVSGVFPAETSFRANQDSKLFPTKRKNLRGLEQDLLALIAGEFGFK